MFYLAIILVFLLSAPVWLYLGLSFLLYLLPIHDRRILQDKLTQNFAIKFGPFIKQFRSLGKNKRAPEEQKEFSETDTYCYSIGAC